VKYANAINHSVLELVCLAASRTTCADQRMGVDEVAIEH
jgi:hypothetical protein